MRIIWGRHPQGGAVTSFDVEDDDDDDDKSLTQCQRAVEDLPEVGRSQNLIEIAYSKRGFASVFPERNDNIEPLGNSTVNTATSISDSDFKLEELFNLVFQNKGSKLFHFLRAPIPPLNVN